MTEKPRIRLEGWYDIGGCRVSETWVCRGPIGDGYFYGWGGNPDEAYKSWEQQICWAVPPRDEALLWGLFADWGVAEPEKASK